MLKECRGLNFDPKKVTFEIVSYDAARTNQTNMPGPQMDKARRNNCFSVFPWKRLGLVGYRRRRSVLHV